MKLGHNYYVYIVQCSDGFYYTGVTNDVNRRLAEHDEGVNPGCFTYKRRPVTLKYYEYFSDILLAIQREKQLKKWSRAKKEALFNENYEVLKELSKNGLKRALRMSPFGGAQGDKA
jgi:putative endonuclease